MENIGRYQVKTEQGRGGMATVFHAYDPRFGRDVAIKVLPQQFLHDPMFRERFDREAHTIAGLEHAAIVPVYDFGEDGGQPYIVMRYMTGGSLATHLKTGNLSVETAAAIFQRISTALDEAHKRGIIHRDLKPGNILFDQYGDAFLSDFGIAKLTESTAALTGSAIIGTPAYMSPEQARGEANVDGRSDVYSLGVILFEMLTGVAPYEADTPMGVAIKHILDPVPQILQIKPDLPAGIDAVIARAMAKDPDHRFQTAGEMASVLSAVAAGEAIPASTTPMPRIQAQPPTQQPVIAPPPVVPPRPGGWATQVEPPLAAIQEPAPTPAFPAAPAQIPTHHALVGPAAALPVNERAHHAPPPERQKVRKRRWTAGCMLLMLILALSGASGFFALLKLPFVAAFGLSDRREEPGPQPEPVLHEIYQPLYAEEVETLDVYIEVINSSVNLYALEEADEAGTAYEGTYDGFPVEIDDAQDALQIRETFEQFQGFNQSTEGTLDLGLTTQVPIDLTVKVQKGDSTIDLTGLTLNSLTIEGGVGRLNVILPSRGTVDVNISALGAEIVIEPPEDASELVLESLVVRSEGGAIEVELPDSGVSYVDISSTIAGITLVIPENLPARVEVATEGRAHVANVNDRLEEQEENIWQTTDYDAEAETGVLITISTTLGSITLAD